MRVIIECVLAKEQVSVAKNTRKRAKKPFFCCCCTEEEESGMGGEFGVLWHAPRPERTFRRSRTPKCDPKKFSILVFFSSVGKIFGSRFGVRSHCGIVLFGSHCHCEVFPDSLLVRTLARNSINGFPTTTAVAARSARHCGLSKSFWLQAD